MPPVECRPPFKGFDTTFHDGRDSVDYRLSIQRAGLKHVSTTTIRTHLYHPVGIPKHRNIRIVRGKYDLRGSASCKDRTDQRVYNKSIVYMVLRLIHNEHFV